MWLELSHSQRSGGWSEVFTAAPYMEMGTSKRLIWLEVSPQLSLCGWKPWLERGWCGWCFFTSNQEIPVPDWVPTKPASDQPFSPTTKPLSTTAFQPHQLLQEVSLI